MDTYFLVDTCQVLLTDIGNLNYLTGVYLFRRIDRGANGLLLSSVDALEQVSCLLRLVHLSVFTLTYYVIHEDNEIINFADLWLLGSSGARRSPASISTTRWYSTWFRWTAFSLFSISDCNTLLSSGMNLRRFVLLTWTVYHFIFAFFLLIMCKSV